ncbi:MAG: NADP-dependent malic enzyme [Rickettsiaceae bacterium]
MNKSKYNESLAYHENDKPGKISITATKSLLSQDDLSLAYSPWVSAPCLEIQKDQNNIYKYTSRGNMVAVISNGTAVLGLGNLGAAAAKPVMEGKAILFKHFADIDAIDLEVSTNNPEEFINVVKHLEYSWGGINLEDIKAPECFIIEKELKRIMNIPVFHDDQHGTAIIAAAGILNSAKITNRKLDSMRIVISGAGAAAIASAELFIELGIKQQNIILCDTRGVIYKDRKEGMNQWKEKYCVDTNLRTLEEVMNGADVFLGLSVKGAVTKDMVASMAKNPVILALANPDPEILPEDVKSVRSDAIIATGRSDYPNQVNNVMAFPYIFRGALDVRATTINKEMKIAAVNAIADLAQTPVPNEVLKVYPDYSMNFGSEYIIPTPFDPRLITVVPLAVAQAAIKSNVAKEEHFDIEKYQEKLYARLNPTSVYMNSVFDRIAAHPQRLIFAEGEEEEIIKAAITIQEHRYAKPILIGRKNKIDPIIDKIQGSLDGIQISNAAVAKDLQKYIDILYKKLQRKGYLYRDCAKLVKSDKNVFAACMLECGDADAMVTGLTKNYFNALDDIVKIIPAKNNKRILAYSALISKDHNLIIADNNISEMPSAQDLVEITIQTAQKAKLMGHKPRVALLSFSNFGSPEKTRNKAVREAVKILDTMDLNFEYDGEMRPDVALSKDLHKIYPFCKLSGPANVLIMPGLNSAAISTKLLQTLGHGVLIGPILDGFTHPVQIVPMRSTTSEIVTLAAFAAFDAINTE